MGNCCFSVSSNAEPNGRLAYVHHPQTPREEQMPSTLIQAGDSSGVFVTTNLETMIRQIPGVSPTSIGRDDLKNLNGLETLVRPVLSCTVDQKSKHGYEINSLEVIQDDFIKPPQTPAEDEPDECPICLEEYDLENPNISTKCEHQFHLSCILEWMERSDICPLCHKILILEDV